MYYLRPRRPLFIHRRFSGVSMTAHAVYLDCPFKEKDEAKRLGARFDGGRKQWFVPAGLDLAPFRRWLPPDFQPTAEISKHERESENIAEQEDGAGQSLSNLLANIRATLLTHHGSDYWVRAEVVNISGSHHRYLELAEYDANGQEVAKARAALWQQRAELLLPRFETATGLTLGAEMKVLLKLAVDFHPLYGFSLIIQDLDPNYTLGEMAAKVARIRAQLIEQGVFALNRRFTLPPDFSRVAVLAPALAAGLGDFQSQAELLSQAGLCEFVYYHATFQGKACVSEIPAAVAQINTAHQQQPFDALIMIRGGGAKGDLYQLNQIEIVQAVCTAQLPVIIGIGHERDRTLLDEVACHAAHTPSLVAAFITTCIVQNARTAAQHWRWIQSSSREQLNRARWLSEQHYQAVRAQAVKQLTDSRQQLALLEYTVQQSARNQLQFARQQLSSLIQQVLLGDPKAVLKRGFALVRDVDGRVLSSHAQAIQQERLTIVFQDGELACHKVA